MNMHSIWKEKSSSATFSTLTDSITADVAVIGGGITGITTAQLLKDHGFKVVVIEARKVGKGTTGNSTGNLYGLTEYSFKDLLDKYDLPTIQKIVLARIKAVHLIQKNVEYFNID